MFKEDLENVNWNEGSHVHNWRRYVPEDVRDMWHTFTPEQKQALYQWADDIADNEEWE